MNLGTFQSVGHVEENLGCGNYHVGPVGLEIVATDAFVDGQRLHFVVYLLQVAHGQYVVATLFVAFVKQARELVDIAARPHYNDTRILEKLFTAKEGCSRIAGL